MRDETQKFKDQEKESHNVLDKLKEEFQNKKKAKAPAATNTTSAPTATKTPAKSNPKPPTKAAAKTPTKSTLPKPTKKSSV